MFFSKRLFLGFFIFIPALMGILNFIFLSLIMFFLFADQNIVDIKMFFISYIILISIFFTFISFLLIKNFIKDVEKRKSEFITIVSHQLRTPLTGTKWLIELLLHNKAGSLQDKQRHFLQQAYQSNEKMIEVVNTLLERKLNQ